MWLIDMTDGQTRIQLSAFAVQYVGKEDPLRFEPALASIIQIYKQVEESPWIFTLPPVIGGKTSATKDAEIEVNFGKLENIMVLSTRKELVIENL